jgi:hypothetical protein
VTYAFTQDVPIDEGFYQRITDGLGPELPKGLITHVAMKRPEGGLRYIDIWEPEEDFDRFVEGRLHPVLQPMLKAIFGAVPPEPETTPLAVIHVWSNPEASNWH